jgi:hypothetical protein
MCEAFRNDAHIQAFLETLSKRRAKGLNWRDTDVNDLGVSLDAHHGPRAIAGCSIG